MNIVKQFHKYFSLQSQFNYKFARRVGRPKTYGNNFQSQQDQISNQNNKFEQNENENNLDFLEKVHNSMMGLEQNQSSIIQNEKNKNLQDQINKNQSEKPKYQQNYDEDQYNQIQKMILEQQKRGLKKQKVDQLLQQKQQLQKVQSEEEQYDHLYQQQQQQGLNLQQQQLEDIQNQNNIKNKKYIEIADKKLNDIKEQLITVLSQINKNQTSQEQLYNGQNNNNSNKQQKNFYKQLELIREDLNEVYELYDQNLDKHRDLDKIADMYFQQAIVSQHLGETEEALFLYDQIQQIYEKQEDQSNLGVVLNNIGNIYFHLKKFYKSERYHQKALKVRKKLKSKQEMVQSYQNLGNIYIEMGDKAKYESCFKKSLELQEEIPDADPMELALQYHDFGIILISLNDLNSSYEYLMKAQELFTQIEQGFFAQQHDSQNQEDKQEQFNNQEIQIKIYRAMNFYSVGICAQSLKELQSVAVTQFNYAIEYFYQLNKLDKSQAMLYNKKIEEIQRYLANLQIK